MIETRESASQKNESKVSQQVKVTKRDFKLEKDSQQGKSGRKIPQQPNKKTQLHTTLKKKMHESKEKGEEIKCKIQTYSSKLQEDANNHHKAQLQQIIGAVNNLSQIRDKQLRQLRKIMEVMQTNPPSSRQHKLKRYRILDDTLLIQKRTTLQNIINKSQGMPAKKFMVKMIQIDDIDILPSELYELEKKIAETTMERLELLIKTEYGWMAIGKNKEAGMFMADVNLLSDQDWRTIEQLIAF